MILNHLQSGLYYGQLVTPQQNFVELGQRLDWSHGDKTAFMKTTAPFIKVPLISTIALSRN